MQPDRVPATTRTFRNAAARRDELAAQADRAFRIIASALDVVCDPKKRKQYGAGRSGATTGWTPMETDDAYGFADENESSLARLH